MRTSRIMLLMFAALCTGYFLQVCNSGKTHIKHVALRAHALTRKLPTFHMKPLPLRDAGIQSLLAFRLLRPVAPIAPHAYPAVTLAAAGIAPTPAPTEKTIAVRVVASLRDLLDSTHHWHFARYLVTAYLIVDNQDLPNHHCPVYNNHTADGDTVHVGSVAVDTDYIPFGSTIAIPGYGKGIADDRGGFINRHHIDLAMTSCRQAIQWGARHMLIAYGR